MPLHAWGKYGAMRAIALAVVGMSVAAPAHAYIDPGTGSYLLQVIFGIVMGAIVLPKSFIRTALARRKERRASVPAEETPPVGEEVRE